MKKLLGILVLGLLWCNVSVAHYLGQSTSKILLFYHKIIHYVDDLNGLVLYTLLLVVGIGIVFLLIRSFKNLFRHL